MIYDRRTVDRCLKYSFELKKKRNELKKTYAAKPIHLVHKRNVLTYCGDLWYRAFEEMAQRLIRILNAIMPMWTRQRCGLLKIPSGST